MPNYIKKIILDDGAKIRISYPGNKTQQGHITVICGRNHTGKSYILQQTSKALKGREKNRKGQLTSPENLIVELSDLDENPDLPTFEQILSVEDTTSIKRDYEKIISDTFSSYSYSRLGVAMFFEETYSNNDEPTTSGFNNSLGNVVEYFNRIIQDNNNYIRYVDTLKKIFQEYLMEDFRRIITNTKTREKIFVNELIMFLEENFLEDFIQSLVNDFNEYLRNDCVSFLQKCFLYFARDDNFLQNFLDNFKINFQEDFKIHSEYFILNYFQRKPKIRQIMKEVYDNFNIEDLERYILQKFVSTFHELWESSFPNLMYQYFLFEYLQYFQINYRVNTNNTVNSSQVQHIFSAFISSNIPSEEFIEIVSSVIQQLRNVPGIIRHIESYIECMRKLVMDYEQDINHQLSNRLDRMVSDIRRISSIHRIISREYNQAHNKIYLCNQENPLVNVFQQLVKGHLYFAFSIGNEGEPTFVIRSYDGNWAIKYKDWSDGQKTLFTSLLHIDSVKPKIFLLDEIEIHFHPEYISQLLKFIKDKVKQSIIVTHNPHVIFSSLADRVIYIEPSSQANSERLEQPETIITINGDFFNKCIADREIKQLDTYFDKVQSTYALFDQKDNQSILLNPLFSADAWNQSPDGENKTPRDDLFDKVRASGIPEHLFLQFTELMILLCNKKYEKNSISPALLLKLVKNEREVNSYLEDNECKSIKKDITLKDCIQEIKDRDLNVNQEDKAFVVIKKDTEYTFEDGSNYTFCLQELGENNQDTESYDNSQLYEPHPVQNLTKDSKDPKDSGGCGWVLPGDSSIKLYIKGEFVANYRAGAWKPRNFEDYDLKIQDLANRFEDYIDLLGQSQFWSLAISQHHRSPAILLLKAKIFVQWYLEKWYSYRIFLQAFKISLLASERPSGPSTALLLKVRIFVQWYLKKWYPYRILLQAFKICLLASEKRSGITLAIELQDGKIWNLCDINSKNNSEELKTIDDLKDKDDLERYLNTIAGDGAAILDRNGNTLAVNAIFQPRANTLLIKSQIVSKGTRHINSQKITKEVPSAIIFVVSTDGPITVFHEGKAVFRVL